MSSTKSAGNGREKGVALVSLKVFQFLASLKLAVTVMTGLTVAMIVATVIESVADTPTAQYWVYRSLWFYALLFMLGVNIFVVAVSRWPWRRHHAAFLLAHAGILLLLAGSWVTFRFGLDGMMRVQEGKSSATVEVSDNQLYFTEDTGVKSFPIEWLPPDVRLKPFDISEYQVRVEEFITHADPSYEFKDAPAGEGFPAVKLLVQGGFMRIRQEYQLWAGDPAWARIQAGPATISLARGDVFGKDAVPQAMGFGGMPGVRLDLLLTSKGEWKFRAVNSEGKEKLGAARAGESIDPGWKGGVNITLLEARPSATSLVTYVPAKIQYGNQAPPSAIRITAGKTREASMWLGLGDRATLNLGARTVAVAYLPKRYQLPHSIRLDQFKIDFYEGTRNPASFASDVTVLDPSHPDEKLRQFPLKISMNEPLHHRELTFYQSSYEPAEPRPTVSIFSVNRDPGRSTKYAGSLLLVAGVIWLFVEKLRKSRGGRARSVRAEVPREQQELGVTG